MTRFRPNREQPGRPCRGLVLVVLLVVLVLVLVVLLVVLVLVLVLVTAVDRDLHTP